MEINVLLKKSVAGIILPFLLIAESVSQDISVLSLDKAVEIALQNNRLLNIKKLQVNEKEQKVTESRIKYLPVVGLGGSYQYNTSLPSISIEKGRFGQLPLGGMIIPLPAIDEIIEVGSHNVYNAGVSLYQPVSQLGKINAGVRITETELEIAKNEYDKAALQIRQGVEKLYFGLLISEKKIEEAELKLLLAETRLADAEIAVKAGKATESGMFGLSAAAADEEQNLLKLQIEHEDLTAGLLHLTGLNPDTRLTLLPPEEDYLLADPFPAGSSAIPDIENNKDLKNAGLTRLMADYAIKAAKFSYLPDIGLLGGYTYQEGTDIYPRNNAFIGASVQWNLQDVLTNRTVQRQRSLSRLQAEENLINTREQVNRDIAAAMRRIRQAEELIKVAAKVCDYRSADLRIHTDKRRSGLNLEADLLSARAAMARAEADLFAARMNHRIALTELEILTGNYREQAAHLPAGHSRMAPAVQP